MDVMSKSEYLIDEISQESKKLGDDINTILHELKKVIIGQDGVLERLLMAMVSNGHILLEGVPGLAKTLMVKTLSQTIHASFNRIQFTPDLLPAAIAALSKIKKRGIVFIISDFIVDDLKAMKFPLRSLRNRHEVIAIDLSDKRERDIPDIGWVWLEDCETGEQVIVNTSDVNFRKEFTKTDTAARRYLNLGPLRTPLSPHQR